VRKNSVDALMLLTAPLETFITVAFLIAAFVDVKTAVRAFNWMSGVWPSGSDTMWPTAKFAHLLNLTVLFENGRKERHSQKCRSRWYAVQF
jgi:hypothetical protein